jgi:sugar lactone lactonase YvrE
VLRVQPGGQSTLTTNTAPPGPVNLDDPADMAFLPGGDIVVTDQGFTTGIPQVAEVDPGTGVRTVISSASRGTGPALVMPNSVAVGPGGDILVTDIAPVTGNPRLLRINPATGNRSVLTGPGVGTGPAVNVAAVGVEGGVIYVTDVVGNQIMRVDPATGNRTLVSGPGAGTGAPFVSPVSITSDRPGSIVVLDAERPAAGVPGLGALVRVDLATGDRRLISDNANPTGGEQFDTPIDVQYNACENAFYVLQTGFSPALPAGRVLKVDAATGVRTLFAGYTGAENYALLLRPIPVPVP